MPQQRKTTVARILSQYEIVVAVGETDGIKVGDQFTVIGNSDDKIVDPETNEFLGFVPVPKAVVRAKQVFERFTICENANTGYSSLFSKGATTASFAARSPLNVRPEDIQGIGENTKTSPIEIGDEVDYVH